MAFSRYFIDNFRNPKILHVAIVACHNMSQIYVIKTLCPFQAVIILLVMIFNIVLKAHPTDSNGINRNNLPETPGHNE